MKALTGKHAEALKSDQKGKKGLQSFISGSHQTTKSTVVTLSNGEAFRISSEPLRPASASVKR